MHAGPEPVFHRDIRKPNIIKCIDSSEWFLIDFSEASKAPTSKVEHLAAASHSPMIRFDNHGAEVDIWGVAYYMSELAGDEHAVVRDKTLVQNMAMKWQSDLTITAEMALAELEVGTLSPMVYCIYGLVFVAGSKAPFHGFGRRAYHFLCDGIAAPKEEGQNFGGRGDGIVVPKEEGQK